MSRSRLFVLSSFVRVAVGALAALGALILSPARASVGPLPAEALVLPADVAFVGGIDVKRLVASPFYERYGRSGMRPESFAELEAKTGLDPERDLDAVVIAGARGKSAVAMVSGTFDRYKLGRQLEGEKSVTHEKEHGSEIYLFGEGSKGPGALAFVDDHTLFLGDQPAVEAMLASRAAGQKPLRSNAAFVELLETVKPGSTFWVVGDKSLLAELPKLVPAPGVGGSSMELPALRSLTMTGDLDPVVSVEVTGGAADQAAAKQLADVVRGLTALLALQSSQNPRLKQVASAISVTTQNDHVHLSARFPYELFDALQPKTPSDVPRQSR